MEKPEITEVDGFYLISYVLNGDSKIQIVNIEGGKSYQTIKFPAGTTVELKISKLPIEEKK